MINGLGQPVFSNRLYVFAYYVNVENYERKEKTMSRLVINGGRPLCGVVRIQGAKNSVLPILAASLLADEPCVISNCPHISDADTAVEILEALGARAERYSDRVETDASNAFKCVIPDGLMRKMRSSIVFLGAIVSKCGRARVSFPGGCDIGCRPIDLHISSLEKMNISVLGKNGFLECRTDVIKGAEINLSFPSVGATENIMLAACKAKGDTVIENAAREPEIVDLQNFINAMGGDVRGAGTSRIEICGVEKLHGVNYQIIPDRIVAATYLCAVAASRGCALLKNVRPNDLSSVISLLRDAGCDISAYDDSISIDCEKIKSIRGVDSVRTMPYPGFPTDAGSPFVALMTLAKGSTVFVETVFENRFKYVGELLRMGADIKTEGRVAVIDGVEKLFGTSVEAHDLRGGAALCVAAVAAEGTTEIDRAEYILRGYEHIEKDLRDLGADIEFFEY